jgi:hypothetical protein
MLGRGHSPRKVALTFHAVTVAFAAAGLLALRASPAPFRLAGTLGLALLAAAIALGLSATTDGVSRSARSKFASRQR